MTEFTRNELDELSKYVLFSDGLSIDGKSITCFLMLNSLANKKSNFTEYSGSEITDAIEQIGLVKEFFQAVGVSDYALLDKLLVYLKS